VIPEKDRVEALKLLGLPRRARVEEIRATYVRLARELHPDLHPDDAERAATFQRVAAAYDVLRRWHRQAAVSRAGPTRDGNAFDKDWWNAFGERV
jgi:DnaJ-class molecular chaperone